jgi:purine catabolism regulator
VAAAESHRLPLIVLERETQFIEITEAVHGLIIDAQLAELRSADRLHQVFTELAVSGAEADEVVSQAAALTGCPVVLENLAHQVLACAPAGQDAASMLASFAARSRAVTLAGRTSYDATAGWLVTTVGARGEDWGRLIIMRPGQPAASDVVLIERAATTLALGRLLDHQQASVERHAHRTVLSAFFGHGFSDPAEAAARARALGVPVTGRPLLAVVIYLDGKGASLAGLARTAAVADAVAAACQEQRVPVLVSSLDHDRVAALLALPPRADADAVLGRLARQLRPRLADRDVIGAGSVVESVAEVQHSFADAAHVAAAAARTGATQPFYRLPDLRLHGLLHLLRDDPRLQAFAERELGPLLAHDHAAGSQLMQALTAYLEAGGNKAEAAKRAHLARPTMYERLRQISAVLGTDIEPAESRLSLHVALLALQSAAGQPLASAG